MDPTAMAEPLLDANRALFEQGNYESAFHVLMAVLHIADKAGDMAMVDQVSAIAERQGAAVDAIEPPHLLSARSALIRGQTAVFHTLKAHAQSIKARHRV